MDMRVLMYSSTARKNVGGVPTVYHGLARRLRQSGHSVTEAWSAPHPEAVERESIFRLANFSMRDGLPSPRSMARVARSLIQLVWGLLKHRPQVVNIHFVRRESAYFLLLRRLFAYKVVLSAHGSDILVPTPSNGRLLPYLLSRADAVTAVTQRIADRILAIPGVDPQKVHVIPNGIDSEYWGGGCRSSPRPNAAPLIVTVGRLTSVKGHDILIRALARAREQVPGTRVIIAGHGKARQSLEKLAREMDVLDSTEFAGHVSRECVRSLLHAADVFALPSRSEGMPLALLEAMAAGLPSVASNVGGVPELMAAGVPSVLSGIEGVPELLTVGAGVLVPPDDPVLLAEGLVSVLTNDVLASEMSRNAVERARTFSRSSSEDAYVDLLADVVSRG